MKHSNFLMSYYFILTEILCEIIQDFWWNLHRKFLMAYYFKNKSFIK